MIIVHVWSVLSCKEDSIWTTMPMLLTTLQMPDVCWQKYMVMKNGRYQINVDVLLFPWKLTYKNPGTGLVPKGSFGKVHLAQDTASRKRMACKLVSPEAESCLSWRHSRFHPQGEEHFHTPARLSSPT